MRQTSIEAYKMIKENGLLKRLRFEIYEALFQNGPATANEIWSKYFPERLQHSITPRFSELLNMGVIKIAGERPCEYTGNKSIIWDLSDNLPISLPKKETAKQKIARLEAEIQLLKEKYESNQTSPSVRNT